MSELDEAWAFALAEAETRARMAGHVDLAAYLSLRTSNDLVRTTGIQWLMSTVERLAAEANRHGGSIQISKDEKHRFQDGSATDGVAALLTPLRRSTTPDRSWLAPSTARWCGAGRRNSRAPNIRHFRDQAATTIIDAGDSKGVPRWVSLNPPGADGEIFRVSLRAHIARSLIVRQSVRKRDFHALNKISSQSLRDTLIKTELFAVRKVALRTD